MHKMLEPQEWMRQSLDAGALALRAVIDGRALPVDDLIAGTMAVELLTAQAATLRRSTCTTSCTVPACC
jgi:hypothetical protein